MPVSHGYYVVEDQSFRGGSDDFECSSVVVQREPVGDIECWFFGVSDNQIADGIHKYIQSHLFSKNPNVVMNILHNAIPFKDYFHEKKWLLQPIHMNVKSALINNATGQAAYMLPFEHTVAYRIISYVSCLTVCFNANLKRIMKRLPILQWNVILAMILIKNKFCLVLKGQKKHKILVPYWLLPSLSFPIFPYLDIVLFRLRLGGIAKR